MRKPTPLEQREALVSYLQRFIGEPYYWTGDGRKRLGFDCSGLIMEGLWSLGLADRTDRTAQAIYALFANHDDGRISKAHGNLIFFGKSKNEITHIGLTINEFQYIEAGGGDSRNLAGMVRIRPLNHRKDVVAIIDFIKE